ncbi:Uncharacterised protein [Legionella donaldsonii]|uniref:Uncharacterized protein n=1 Tax=Legionella donaldsonii TaxID=45060 RepID=A0A378J396_9GAMM|nr:hypothetical protein [Legionella donaldsonii]STX41441.1 Uncharacterised protein [Legionella donaldsonii]
MFNNRVLFFLIVCLAVNPAFAWWTSVKPHSTFRYKNLHVEIPPLEAVKAKAGRDHGLHYVEFAQSGFWMAGRGYSIDWFFYCNRQSKNFSKKDYIGMEKSLHDIVHEGMINKKSCQFTTVNSHSAYQCSISGVVDSVPANVLVTFMYTKGIMVVATVYQPAEKKEPINKQEYARFIRSINVDYDNEYAQKCAKLQADNKKRS